MVNCCVKGCKSRSEQNYENITFHTFPKNVTVRNVWISATGRLNWEPTKYSRICSKHFKDHCFRKTQYKVYLNKFSFPTLTIHKIEKGSVLSTTQVEITPRKRKSIKKLQTYYVR